MKILYFHQYFKTLNGTGGTRSYEMAKYFIENGHKVTMVYIVTEEKYSILTNPYKNGLRRGTIDGIDLIEFNLSYSNKLNFIERTKVFLSYSIRSIKLALREDYDILFASSTPLTASIPGIVIKLFRKKKPFVFEVRDLWPEAPYEMGVIKNRFILWMLSVLEYLSYNMADACIGLSPGIVEGIKRRLKKNKPVYLIPNGCDLDIFKPYRASKSVFSGIEDDFIAIYTGAHGFANGLDIALDTAAKLLKTEYSERIKFIFVGDGIMKEKLVARKHNEDLFNCIFLDPMPKKELVRILQASDIGLMLFANVRAFYYGTSPNKFFDYISVGLPVLNNYPGWVADMITENKCGLVITPDNPDVFADALIQLYRNRNQLPEMGKNSRRLAEAKFDRKDLANQLLRALELVFNSYSGIK